VTDLDPFHKHLLDAIQTESADFDKFVGTAGLALFGGSFAGATMLAPPFATDTSWLLWTCWVATAASLVAMASSKLTSQRGLRKHLENDVAGIAELVKDPGGAYGLWTTRLNRIAMVALGFGLVSFLVFGYLNLSHLEHPNAKPEKHTAYPDAGSVP
jgi:hypothetical protein